MNFTEKQYELKNSLRHNLFLACYMETAELSVQHRFRGTSNTRTMLDHSPIVLRVACRKFLIKIVTSRGVGTPVLSFATSTLPETRRRMSSL